MTSSSPTSSPTRSSAGAVAGRRYQSGGRIVLSGILAEQAEDVMRIYAQWFDLAPAVLEDGWCCLSGMKR